MRGGDKLETGANCLGDTCSAGLLGFFEEFGWDFDGDLARGAHVWRVPWGVPVFRMEFSGNLLNLWDAGNVYAGHIGKRCRINRELTD